MSKHPAEETLSLMDKVEKQEKDLESLREAVKIKNECLDLVRTERDEWKRRAKILATWCDYEQKEERYGSWSDFLYSHPEAADWFKEEE